MAAPTGSDPLAMVPDPTCRSSMIAAAGAPLPPPPEKLLELPPSSPNSGKHACHASARHHLSPHGRRRATIVAAVKIKICMQAFTTISSSILLLHRSPRCAPLPHLILHLHGDLSRPGWHRGHPSRPTTPPPPSPRHDHRAHLLPPHPLRRTAPSSHFTDASRSLMANRPIKPLTPLAMFAIRPELPSPQPILILDMCHHCFTGRSGWTRPDVQYPTESYPITWYDGTVMAQG